MLYLVVIGLCLTFAHRPYWWMHKNAGSLRMGLACKSALVAASAALPLVTVCVVTAAFCAFIDKMSFADIGLRTDLRPGAALGTGIVVAFATVSLVFITGYLKGWFHVSSTRLSSDFCKKLPLFCGGVSDFVNASIFEEIIMRGYVFTVLYRDVGPVPAVLGSAAAFSVSHLVTHMRLPAMFTINAFLFGMLVAQSRLVTGAIWMPIGLHIGWNVAAATVFGLPLAGRVYNGGLLTCSVEGPEWFTGGYYSPDAGLLGTMALMFTASVLVILKPLA